MVQAARVLNIPVLATEQNPSRLGKTVSEVDVTGVEVFEKKLFSMLIPPLEDRLKQLNVKQAVLFGIESHVCVLQTSLDLLEKGYEVHLVTDGVSSQRPFDRQIAIERLKTAGVFLTTSESALFQLIQSADHAKFKEISALVKAPPPIKDYGLFPQANL
eukprot:CAMPEP_0196661558 /NCGR_PEP_ID=MMETSP1086-20130531/44862_1 /TAXON_ID=77921 /ORGANISM="Cyanoptyche  gloeocystis , Strain SAG4.97" /LENGTH=158 /DNA_ID=CAMNT_0041996509 /DNA_START=186 /DNA_END=662 /DNA_ORIENTATION=+